MTAPSKDAIFRKLEQFDRATLDALAVEAAMNHVRLCALASARVEGAGGEHASEAEIHERVRKMDEREIAEILAAEAWIGATVGTRASP